MDIPGVPDTIARGKISALVEALGLELRDLLSFSVRRESVEAIVVARDEAGHAYAVDDEVATHALSIRITDEEQGDEDCPLPLSAEDFSRATAAGQAQVQAGLDYARQHYG